MSLCAIAAPSKHSRAARRAVSPGIDLDKSLKEVKLPDKNHIRRPAILAAHANAGVSKKTSKRKSVISSRARKRRERAVNRAEAVLEKTILKVERSRGQVKTLQSRRKDWDQINKIRPAKSLTLLDVIKDQDRVDKPVAATIDDLDDEMSSEEKEILEEPRQTIVAAPPTIKKEDDVLDEIL